MSSTKITISKEVQTIKNALFESNGREFCQWLEHTNPSPAHNAAKSLYENETGAWVLRSQKWIDWINLKTRCIWIHGIPGSGKTVLASYLIEQVRLMCQSGDGPKSEYVYYYCHHGRNQDEAVPFLRWLISQLCRQAQGIPEKAYAAFKRGQELSLSELLDILHSVLSGQGTIFTIIDAVDESRPRANLLKVIQDLMTDARFQKIQLLVTSREETNIETTMAKISDPISMSNPLVEADIKVYISRRIQAELRFQRWPRRLQDDVEDSLSKGAKGMFRWAVCQLDILRRLRHEDKIRASLQNLPQGLDESYERIFSLIDTEDRDLVKHALHWLCFHTFLWSDYYRGSPTISILLDSYIYSSTDRHKSNTNEGQHFIDANTLKETCGCLLSYSEIDIDGELETRVTLAHYTVREFLESDRNTGPFAMFFKIGRDESYANIYDVIFRYSLGVELPPRAIDDIRNSQIGLEEYCQLSATRALHTQPGCVQYGVALEFLDFSKPHYKALVASLERLADLRFLGDYSVNTWKTLFSDIDWSNYRGDFQIAMLINLLHSGLLQLAQEFCVSVSKASTEAKLQVSMVVWSHWENAYIDWKFNGTIVELFACCPSGDRMPFQLLYNRFSDGVDCTRLLHLHIGNHLHEIERSQGLGSECLILKLLRNGAKPRPRSCQVTPLQIAAARVDVVAVRLLLEAHADPNDAGDADNNEWDDDSHLSYLTFLGGSSPLYILRKLMDMEVDSVLESHSRIEGVRIIERLLLSYGAREFTVKGKPKRRRW